MPILITPDTLPALSATPWAPRLPGLLVPRRWEVGPAVYNSGHGKAENTLGPPVAQGPGAGVQGSPSRKYIIYQQYPQVVNSCSLPRLISATDRPPAFLAGEPEFVRARLGAHQKLRAHFEAQPPGQGTRQELRLIETPLAQTGRMQRYWYHDVHREIFGIGGEHLCQP